MVFTRLLIYMPAETVGLGLVLLWQNCSPEHSVLDNEEENFAGHVFVY